MKAPKGLPEEVLRVVTREYIGVREDEAGWYAVNSIVPGDCRPAYRTPGGGVCADQLTDLPTAMDRCISYTKQRIEAAQLHLRKLEAARAALTVSVGGIK